MGINPSVSMSGISSEVGQVQINATQAALSSAAGGGGGADMTISNIGDFQKKHPALAKAFLQSFAYNVCRDMQDSNDRIIAEQRKAQQDGG